MTRLDASPTPDEAVGERLTTPLTRQQFLFRSALAGLSMSAVGGVLAACGSSSDSPGATGAGGVSSIGTAAVRTPAARGQLARAVWGLNYEPASLDWILAYAPSENAVVANINEGLMRLTPEFTYEPGLAQSVATPDAKTYVFKLRPGVRFSDGSPMTADDVVFSLKRAASPASYWATWTSNELNVLKTADDEVTVHLKRPDALFLQMMATPAGAVSKASYVQQAGKAYGTAKALPIGTGPFKATSWASGSTITLERNEGYWDTAAMPKTAKLEFTFASSEASLISSLISGQIDGAYNLPYESLAQLQGASAGTLYQGPTMMSECLLFTTRSGPQRDQRIRQAWLHAIDQEAIAKNVFSGAALPLRSTFIPLPVWKHGAAQAQKASDAMPSASDLARAKALVKQAGSPAEPMRIAVQALQLDQNVGAVLQAAAKSIGLHVEVAVLPSSDLNALFYDAKARGKYNGFLVPIQSDVPDAVELLEEILGPPVPNALSYNYSGYDDSAVQQLIARARATADDAKRASLALEAQTRMMSYVPVLPLVAPGSMVFMGKRVTGVPASFCYNLYPWARDLGAA